MVQYIAIIIFIFFTIYAFIDIKKAILIWLPFKLLFNNQIAIRYTSPGIALVIALDISLFFVFLVRERNTKRLYVGKFPFNKINLAFCASYFVSLLFTVAPFQTAIVATVKYFISGFCMLYLAHKAFCSKKDILFFLRCSAIVSLLIISLALLENILRTNPWLDFVYYNSPYDPDEARMFYSPEGLEMRYGLVRSRSFFSFHIPFGFACVCFYWMFFYFYKYVHDFRGSSMFMVVSVMLLAGVFMSNSKQAYIGLLFMIMSLYPLKSVFNLKIVLPIIIIIILIILYIPNYLNNFFSLTDEQLAEEGGGSTIALRGAQYLVAWNMFSQNPIIGNGISSISVLKNQAGNYMILGAESSWLQILPEQGLFGAFVYLYMYKELWKMKKMINKRVLFFFLISIFVMETAGGLKDVSIWCLALLTIYRYNQLSAKNVINITK